MFAIITTRTLPNFHAGKPSTVIERRVVSDFPSRDAATEAGFRQHEAVSQWPWGMEGLTTTVTDLSVRP